MSKSNRQPVIHAAKKMLARGLALNLGKMTQNGFQPITEGQCLELKAAEAGYRNVRTLWAALDKVAQQEEPALEQEFPEESGLDYRLKEGETGCWIRMSPFLVHLYFTDEGMVCDIHSDTPTFGEAIATTYAFYQEAESAACEEFSTGNEFDLDDVAEWVGLHYRKNFETESRAQRIEWIRRYAEAHASSVEAPTPRPAALQAYRVMLHEEQGDKHQLAFDCWASSEEAAMDQAALAYPGSDIRLAFPCEDTDLFVIYAESEAGDEPTAGFWSNTTGWGVGETASLFKAEERAGVNLPISAKSDAKWLSLAAAEQLLANKSK